MKAAAAVGCYIAVLACFLIIYTAATTFGSPKIEQVTPAARPITATLPPTYTPAVPSKKVDYTAELNIALGGYVYAYQRVRVAETEIDGEELVIYLRLQGTPSTDDYFGQLDIIHSIIAKEKPEVETVRTIDIGDETGFMVTMADLLEYSDNLMDYDQFRSLWEYIEPAPEVPAVSG
ncbi:MAG: hypothetical protein ACK2T3_15935 [Candidatus Promineifilaceae bacterium]